MISLISLIVDHGPAYSPTPEQKDCRDSCFGAGDFVVG